MGGVRRAAVLLCNTYVTPRPRPAENPNELRLLNAYPHRKNPNLKPLLNLGLNSRKAMEMTTRALRDPQPWVFAPRCGTPRGELLWRRGPCWRPRVPGGGLLSHEEMTAQTRHLSTMSRTQTTTCLSRRNQTVTSSTANIPNMQNMVPNIQPAR